MTTFDNTFSTCIPLKEWLCIPIEGISAFEKIAAEKFKIRFHSETLNSELEIKFEIVDRENLPEESSELKFVKKFLKALCATSVPLLLIGEHSKLKIFDGLSEEKIRWFILQYLAQEIESQINLFIICCNLAAPGILNAYDEITISSEPFSSNHAFRFGHEIHECLDEENPLYNKVKILDIEKTWLWLNSQPGFSDGKLTTTNVSRSITAFCNLFSWSPSYSMHYPNYFIWSILGVESLYSDGTQSVLYQIKQKSKLILSLKENELNLINKMYNFRSRFFHGQVSLYNPHLHDNLSKEAIKASHEEINFQCTAFMLFLSSLQFCCLNQINDLKFSYHLV